MSIAYLILAHNNPRHLYQLINALHTPGTAFFVHIDRKSTVDFGSYPTEINVRFIKKRFAVYWGDYSIIDATLALLRAALADSRAFHRFVLLSGTDFPLRSASYIQRFFERNNETEFINVVRMPSEAAGKPIDRLKKYRPSSTDSRISGIRRFLELVKAASRERDYTKVLGDLLPYAGSQWWALSRSACEYVDSFTRSHERVMDFFRNTSIPDEMLFQTILANSPLQPRIRRNLTYADWSAGGSHPALITQEHVRYLSTSPQFGEDGLYGGGEMLFARKFSDDHENVVQRLLQVIGEQEDI